MLSKWFRGGYTELSFKARFCLVRYIELGFKAGFLVGYTELGFKVGFCLVKNCPMFSGGTLTHRQISLSAILSFLTWGTNLPGSLRERAGAEPDPPDSPWG